MKREAFLSVALLSSLLSGCHEEAHGREPPPRPSAAAPLTATAPAGVGTAAPGSSPLASSSPRAAGSVAAPAEASGAPAAVPAAPRVLAAGEAPTSPADCPEGEVFVPPTPPGGFPMGHSDRGMTDRPHPVVLTRGFCMDSTEVTVRAYKACVDAGACKLPFLADQFATYPRFPDHPVNMVNWLKARAYCGWAGKRLPTEAEWEWAATGPERTKYPWGNSPEPVCGAELADFTPLGAPKSNPGGDVGCFGGGPSAVKAHPRGAKHWPGGAIHDLAGNVWEWTEDSYEPYATEPRTDPLVRAQSVNHAIRGGGWNRPPRALQGWFRGSAIHRYQVPGLGFRCVRGAPHPTPPPRGGL
jgi:formylglycine-generating enzyme required for sulfatase activity